MLKRAVTLSIHMNFLANALKESRSLMFHDRCSSGAQQDLRIMDQRCIMHVEVELSRDSHDYYQLVCRLLFAMLPSNLLLLLFHPPTGIYVDSSIQVLGVFSH